MKLDALKLVTSTLLQLVVACGGDGGGTAATGGGVDIDEESIFGSGGLTLSGTVTFASSVPEGTGAQVFGGRLGSAGTSLRFRITNLDPDEYRVFARVDSSGSATFESGDLGGYHAGTSASPVQDPASATAIQLDQDLDLAFGVAAIP